MAQSAEWKEIPPLRVIKSWKEFVEFVSKNAVDSPVPFLLDSFDWTALARFKEIDKGIENRFYRVRLHNGAEIHIKYENKVYYVSWHNGRSFTDLDLDRNLIWYQDIIYQSRATILDSDTEKILSSRPK